MQTNIIFLAIPLKKNRQSRLTDCQWPHSLNICLKSIIFYYIAGSNYYVRILSTIDRELLKPSASVALHKHSNALVDVLPPEADSSITMLGAGKLFIDLKQNQSIVQIS